MPSRRLLLVSGGLFLVGALACVGLVSWRPLHVYGGPQFEPVSLGFSILLAVLGLGLTGWALVRR